ncbi:CHASE domain-containing sensor histidine kinase [Anaeromyxobacter oryzisoli]|uniref:CHASE domain-containing sensor histidine kinase n=1 Tax=Anaeromyxobacter oryzisoli TaxID=2925408 RepID=UPI001F5ACC48|nr:CHASE domain-containing protein [Anaeromyxobacter sp. SG63]
MKMPSTLPAVLRRRGALAAVAATGLACSAGAALYVRAVVQAQQDSRFGEIVSASTAAVRDRMDAYAQVLRAARGGVTSLGRDPTAREFEIFADSVAFAEHYPGIQGLGWSVALSPSEVVAHEAAQRAAGRTSYRVWPKGERPLYSAIEMLYPPDWRNERAIGYDMYSDPVRRAAMERARDTGEIAATSPVELVQEAGRERQAGFLLYAAVLARRGDPASLRGWVYAPFRATDLISAALAGERRRAVGLTVFDGGEPDPAALLHDDGLPPAGAVRVLDARIPVGGRSWLLRFTAGPGFATLPERLLPPAALALGLALTALLCWITGTEARARRRAELTVRRTALLAGAGKALSASLEYDRTLARTARLVAGRVADACVVCVLEPEGPLWRVGHRDPAIARRLADALLAAGVDEAALEALPPPAHARPGGGPPAVPPARPTPVLARALADAGLRAALTAPMQARGEAFGAVTFLAARARHLGRADASLVGDLARLASAAVDTARLYRRAQEAVRYRDEFLSIASHELKTPLTSLGLQTESLLVTARREGSEPLARKAEVIRRSVERLARLVASLLDLTRTSAGHLELELEDVDLAALARDVIERFEEEAARTGCALRLDAPTPIVGRWDRLRLDQVLTNLLSNAVKYGAGRPVRVQATSRDGLATLRVEDHGIGVSAADQRRIFERFERAVSRRNYGGFGLGLWIVREIAEALGGRVSVESTPEVGSIFTVELPLVAELAPPRSAAPPRAPAR